GDHEFTYQGEVAVLGRLDMVRTTAESSSCYAGAPTSMAPLVTVCDTHVSRARPAPHYAGLSPRRLSSGPHTSGLGGCLPIRGPLQQMKERGVVGGGIPTPPASSMREARHAPSKALWHARMRRKPRHISCSHRCCRTIVGPGGHVPKLGQ